MKTWKISLYIAAAAVLSACSDDSRPLSPADSLIADLQTTAGEGKILFGHQDAYMYGYTWRASSKDSLDRTDVKDVCGQHPAVLGLDLGGIEFLNLKNLDGNPFGFMREAALRHCAEGGVVTLSWHPRNPLTGGDSWDVSSDKVVASVLDGGEKHDEFMQWLSNCADYLDTFKNDDGELIPLIFRPWHEHTGSWFWWGQKLCTPDQYRQLWKMTYDYMTAERGLDNLVWAFSPGADLGDEEYMTRYPGDDMVDMLGLDCYQYGELPASNETYVAQLRDRLSLMTELGREHGKLIALTETGCEGVPYAKWWTEVLYQAIKDYPIAYVLVWRNACDMPGHYYAPWPGQESEADFKEFAAHDDIIMLE